MGPITISFDVTAALPVAISGGKRIVIAAWLFLPDNLQKLGDKPVVMTLLHGGSYDKRYFHLEIPGYLETSGNSTYSAAQYLAALGNIVFVPDVLGVGDSSRTADQKKTSRQIAALANHAAEMQFYQHLRDGSLYATLPAMANFVKIGAGHSMGGMQIITQQAEYATYDAVIILRFTTIGIHFTINGNVVRIDSPPSNALADDYTQGSRAHLHETFHWSDITPDIIAFDDTLAVPTPSMIGLAAIESCIVAEDAARIEVPVFIGMGERDVSPDAHAEVANYKRSRDIMLHILPRSGHCHNFAGTRHDLWHRMHGWAQLVLS